MHAPDLNAPDDGNGELDALMQDKLETHCRQQLSALVDGALPPDEARFLLRRLQHDDVLAGRWERWQVYGDCMRGGVSQLLPADFSQRVCAALDADQVQALPVAAARGARPVWTRWAGGAALAASVAMAALMVVQREPQAASTGPVQVASRVTAPAADIVASGGGTSGEVSVPVAGDATVPAGAAAGALLLAARERPRRTATRMTAAARHAPRADAPAAVESPPDASAMDVQAVAVSAEGTNPSAGGGRDPFGMEVAADPRPWPRAVLPGVGQGGFSVGYHGASTNVGAFEYFEPRLPPENAQASSTPASDAER